MQEKITLKIKKVHPNAVTPHYAKPGDAGMDLTAVSAEFKDPRKIKVDFGIQMEIPEGFVGLIFPRSSVQKSFCRLSNSVGVIDSGYRGNVMAVFDVLDVAGDLSDKDALVAAEKLYAPGMRCAQIIIMPYPHVSVVEADELSETVRGAGGYGSSGL